MRDQKLICIVNGALSQDAHAPLLPTGMTLADFNAKMANDSPPDKPKEVPMIGG